MVTHTYPPKYENSNTSHCPSCKAKIKNYPVLETIHLNLCLHRLELSHTLATFSDLQEILSTCSSLNFNMQQESPEGD
jgi:hypothetical protein